MNNKEYLIKNKSPLMSSLTIAVIFLLVEIFTLVTGNNPFSEWGTLDFVFVPISILIVIVDTMDLFKIKNGKLMVRLEDEGVRILSYMFSNRYIAYSDMTAVNLREKDVEYTINGKQKTISGPTQSDLIRIMKALRDNIEG